MTNSTDNNEVKPPKKKGPLRIEAIIPVVVITGLLFAYMTFFFDSNLRNGIEWVGSRIHGAEINVGGLKTSFIGGYMQISGIQVTNKDKPEENLIQIGSIRLELHWDALLRAKFVVNEASIENIAISAKRKRPGFIIPDDDPDRSQIKQFEASALQATQDKYNKNVLGDLAAVAGGVDPNEQLKNIEAQLTAEKKINELKADLKTKEAAWKKRIDEISGQKKIKQIEKEFKALKFDSKNVPQFLKDIQKADKLLKEADAEIKKIDRTAKELNKEVNGAGKEIGSVDKWIQQDIDDIQKRMKIPSLDVGDISKSIFLGMLEEKIAPYQKYISVAKEYMPPPKDPNAKEDAPIITPKKRGQGKTYQFPITVSYPLFWLKKAVISSKSTDGGFSGDVSGTLTDVTSAPAAIGRPAVLKVKGDFPTQKVMGLDATVTVDNRKTPTKSTLRGTIAQFPMEPISLSDSDDLKFKIENLVGRSGFSGQLVDEKMNFQVLNKYSQVKYNIDSKNKDVKSLFTNAAAGIPEITLKASAKGKWPNLGWAIDSNLGRELGRGLKKQVQAKIDEAKKKIEDYVNNKIGAEKAALNKQFSQMKSQVDGQVNKAKKQVANEKKRLSGELNKKKKSGENKQKKKIKKEGDKLLKDLKKKFKF